MSLTEEDRNMFANVINKGKYTKIVLLNCLNDYDLSLFIQEIAKFCEKIGVNDYPLINENNKSLKFPYYLAEFNKTKFAQLKGNEKLLFIVCPRSSKMFLDFAKVSDLLINISSVEYVDFNRLNIRPGESLNAIDDLGEETINLLRAQGHLKTINAIVGWANIPQTKHKDVKFYFKRLFEEEYTESKTHFLQSQNDMIKLLMDIQNIGESEIEWRKERGYFLTDSVELGIDNGSKTVLLSGFLKNGLTTQEHVHITGVGDFKVDRIIGRAWLRNKGYVSLVKECNESHPFEVFSNTNELIKEQQG